MENKKFLLSTGKVIEVPGYMENKCGYLFNTNTKLPEGLPGDKVRVKDENIDNSGILEDYTNVQIIKFIGKPGIVVSADSVHSGGAVRIISHNTKIIKEFSDTEISNEYGEFWKKSENGREILENNLDLSSGVLKLMDVAKVSGSSHYIAKFYGGCNGGGNWDNYLDEIKKALRGLHWWMIKLENDCIDDIFYLTIGFIEI